MENINAIVVNLDDTQLLEGLKQLNHKERTLRCHFLSYLMEVERRSLHLEMGYGNLYRFVMKELGHSESEALKRIQVARKAAKFPNLYYALLDGKITMTAASKLSRHLRESNVETLLAECERKSVREVENIIVKHFPKSDVKDKVKRSTAPLSIDRVHVQFSASRAFERQLEKAKAMLSHKYPDGKLEAVFGEALDLLIRKLEPKKSKLSPTAEAKPLSRYIPRGIQSEVWRRDEACCSYVSPNGKRCEETKYLEYDHKTPWAKGGSSQDVSNIRLLCRGHNKLAAEQAFGKSWIGELIERQKLLEKKFQV